MIPKFTGSSDSSYEETTSVTLGRVFFSFFTLAACLSLYLYPFQAPSFGTIKMAADNQGHKMAATSHSSSKWSLHVGAYKMTALLTAKTKWLTLS